MHTGIKKRLFAIFLVITLLTTQVFVFGSVAEGTENSNSVTITDTKGNEPTVNSTGSEGGENTDVTPAPAGGENTGVTPVPAGGENTDVTSVPAGDENTDVTPVPAGGENTDGVPVPAGDENTDVTPVPAGDENTNGDSVPAGGENTGITGNSINGEIRNEKSAIEKLTTEEVEIPIVETVEISPKPTSVTRDSGIQFSAKVTGQGAFDSTVIWNIVEEEKPLGLFTKIDENGFLFIGGREENTQLSVVAVSSSNASVEDRIRFSIVGEMAPLYTLTVENGTLEDGSKSGSYQEGERIKVTFDKSSFPENAVFQKWETVEGLEGGGTFDSYSNESTFFTMGSSNAKIRATIQNAADSVTINEKPAQIGYGKSFQFTATVTGQGTFDDTVTWSVTADSPLASNTKIDQNGLLTVDANEKNAELVITATSNADNSISSSITLKVTSEAETLYQLVLEHAKLDDGSQSGSYPEGERIRITFDKSSFPENAVFQKWETVEGLEGGGTFDSYSNESTFFTMGSSNVKIRATVYYPDQNAAESVTINEKPAQIGYGKSFLFTATVTGQGVFDDTVTWSVTANSPLASNTKIDQTGLLTVDANEKNGELVITATSNADSSISSSITLKVTSEAETLYQLMVEHGTGSGNYRAGEKVTIALDKSTLPSDATFLNWEKTEGEGTFENELKESTIFTMGTTNAVIKPKLSYSKPGKIEKITISDTRNGLSRGITGTKIGLEITGSGNFDDTIIWSMSGSKTVPLSENTKITQTGLVDIDKREKNTSVLITAVSAVDENIKDEKEFQIEKDGMYYLEVVGGSGSGFYRAGEQVRITLDEEKIPENAFFHYWDFQDDTDTSSTGPPERFRDQYSKSTNFHINRSDSKVWPVFSYVHLDFNPNTNEIDFGSWQADSAISPVRGIGITNQSEHDTYSLFAEVVGDGKDAFQLTNPTMQLEPKGQGRIVISPIKDVQPGMYQADLNIHVQKDSNKKLFKTVKLSVEIKPKGKYVYLDRERNCQWFFSYQEGDAGACITEVAPLFEGSPGGNLVLPETVSSPANFIISVPVVKIDQLVFASTEENPLDWIKSIDLTTVPDLEISDTNFYNLQNVTDVFLPENMTVIPFASFQNMKSLKNITLPRNLVEIEDVCFNQLDALEQISFPESLTTIGKSCFQRCKSLTKIKFGSALESIGDINFIDGNLKKAEFENPNTRIGDGSFDSNHFLFKILAQSGGEVENFATRNGIDFGQHWWGYFSFANSSRDFFNSGETQNYTLTDYGNQVLVRNVKKIYSNSFYAAIVIQTLRENMYSPWGGSCYGIAVSEGLFNEERMLISNTRPHEVSYPRQDQNIRSIMNYYYLSQFLTDVLRDPTHWGCMIKDGSLYLNVREDWTGELNRLTNLVEKNPVMLSYTYNGGGFLAGHAIILERVKEKDGNIIRFVARDNRFPGTNGNGETEVVIDLSDYSGCGSMKLHYPSPYYGSEEMLGVEFTDNFAKFYENMPYDSEKSPSVEGQGAIQSKVILDYKSGWELNVNGKSYERDSESIPLHGGSLEFDHFVVASQLDETTPANAPMIYSVEEDSEILFTPAQNPNEDFKFSYLTDSGYASVLATDAAMINVSPNGAVSAEDISGSFQIGTVTSNGNLINIKGKADGSAEDDIFVIPTETGARVTAPAGSYTVLITDANGSQSSKTIENKKDGDIFDINSGSNNNGGGSGGGGGGGSRKNKVEPSITTTQGGKADVSSDGSYITILPDEGYEIEELKVNGTVISEDDKAIKYNKDGSAVYTFDKADQKKKVEVSFCKIVEETAPETVPEIAPEADTGEWKNPYHDVLEKDWFYNDVRYVSENGLFSGMDSTAFGPQVTMTRAMLVTVLWRLAGSPDTDSLSGFQDVPTDTWYTKAVAWAVANGIVSGVTSETFDPEQPVTREQLAAILYRYANFRNIEVTPGENINLASYDDSQSISEYAVTAVQWACNAGLIRGSENKLMPESAASRAEVAAVLRRFQEAVRQ